MTLQEAVARTNGCKNLPDVISSDAGLITIEELNVVGIPSWDRKNVGKPRKVLLKITTWRGISTEAIHYYGVLIVDGVYTAKMGDLQTTQNLSEEEEEKYPLLKYSYSLKITRQILQSEIDQDADRWYSYEVGDNTNAFETIEELISVAREICNLRFSGNWQFLLQYPNGNTVDLFKTQQ